MPLRPLRGKPSWKRPAQAAKAARVKLPPIHLNAPAAIAFSGGGDSTALLHACRDNPFITHAFIIDHALRDGSAEEVANAADYARSLGYEVRVRRWSHSGVSAGIQAKARAFRYAAMGEMCRRKNLQHLVTAHTQDDQAETILMRLDRQTGWRGLAGMPRASFGPLWPALAGVTLHRPWLDVSRADIRAYNMIHGVDFIDDPSNENRDFARVRARQALLADSDLRTDLLDQQKTAREKLGNERQDFARWLKRHAHVHEHGFIETDTVPPSELLLHILNAVSGRGGPVKRARLCRDMSSRDFKAATLAGTWVIRKKEKGSHSFVFLRDKVAVTGRSDVSKLRPVQLNKDDQTIWDGRFICRVKIDDLRVESASGKLQTLRQMPDFKGLFELPAEVRATLPIFYLRDNPIGFGSIENEFISSRACSASRLQALTLRKNLSQFESQ